MSLFGRGAGAASQGDQNARKLQVMESVRQELASAQLQELVNKMTEQCYKTCQPSGSSELYPADKACLARCSDRFFEAFDIVSRTYISRISQERQAAATANPGLSAALPSNSLQ